ncbi:MAG: surface-adhesin E family protein [Pseudomonadota bacterium]
MKVQLGKRCGHVFQRPKIPKVQHDFLPRGASVSRNRSARSAVFSVLLAFLIVGASVAQDTRWQIYSEEANGDVYFFDASQLNPKSRLHGVWTRTQYKTSVMGASSYQSFVELDCADRTVRTLQRTFFSDKHWEKPAMSTDMTAKPKRAIRKGSATERLYDILCTL